MPWRLILFIVVFVVFLVFIGFNLDNKCDISFGFINIPQVPVFYTIFVSFTIGVLVTLPIAVSSRKKTSDAAKNKKPKKEEAPASVGEEFGGQAPDYTSGKYFDKNKRDGKK